MLLAFVVGVAKAPAAAMAAGSTATVIVLTLIYILLLIVVVRPWQSSSAGANSAGGAGQCRLAAMFVAVLLSAVTTQWIGVHAIFGQLLLGAIIPHEKRPLLAI